MFTCKTNHITNPLGFHMPTTTLSWVAAIPSAKTQKAARVLVATDEAMQNIVHDTDFTNLDSRGYILPITLAPRTRYYWTVSVQADNGTAETSQTNWFETAKLAEPWQAKWLTTPWEVIHKREKYADTSVEDRQKLDECPHPYIRKEFALADKKIATARAYVTGMGIYELHINGSIVGDEVLAPLCNCYDQWIQYQTYDITTALQNGQNAVGVMLANGWGKGRFGLGEHYPYTDRFLLLAEIHVTYEDGTTEVIATDETWACKASPVVFDNIYDGVVYDATKEIEGWNTPNFDHGGCGQGCHGDCVTCAGGGWEKMLETEATEMGELTARLSLPVKRMQEIPVQEVLTTPAGETVLDMGQNMVGWLKMRINAPKGTVIKISHGEILQDDNFYRENLRSAKCEYTFIANGKEQIVEPRFSFYGFRFAKIEGIENVRAEDFTGCVLYSALDTVGNIETSDPRVNQLFKNAMWGQKGNFLDVPTDCPQRDERMGWTGDTQVFTGTAMFNMDSYAFYVKFMHDLYQDQQGCDGMVPSVVPLFKSNRPQEPGGMVGCCAWADCATIVPWEVYLHSGDTTILKYQYQSMKDWVDWITRKCEKDGTGLLWTVGFHFGDWLALDGDKDEHGRPGVFGATSTAYLASAYYRYSSMLVSKAAALLGKNEDAAHYAALSEKVKNAMLKEYFPNGELSIKTQTAHVIALQFDLHENKQVLVDGLVEILKENDMRLATGFIGTPFLCRVLSNNGHSEAAYQLFFNEGYPSWLYPVSMGATTIWERWNSVEPNGKLEGTGMNSLNHYAYGSIAEWMYRNMCGINPVEETPGYKKFRLQPEPNKRLEFAKAETLTAMGKVRCGWAWNADGSVTVQAEVPFDTTADIILPNGECKMLDAGEYVFEVKM